MTEKALATTDWKINPDTGEYEVATVNKTMVVDPKDANFQTWDEPGITVKGIFAEAEAVEVKGTASIKYTLRTGPGAFDYISFNGTEKINRLFGREPVTTEHFEDLETALPYGKWIELTYVSANTTKGKNTFKDFEIVVADVK